MASIIYQIDKKTGAKYAFESTSYWDKDKKQPRSKRKYLGKVDPETGEIIPTRGKYSHNEESSLPDNDELRRLHADIKERDQTIQKLREDYAALSDKYNTLLTTMQKIKALAEII